MNSSSEINNSQKLWFKIKNALKKNKITQKEIAQTLEVSETAISLQFKSLAEGNGISTKTLEVIEDKTGVKFLEI